MHQRKHPKKGGHRSDDDFSFNEAAGLHQRKLGRAHVARVRRSSFNEAAGLHQRKRSLNESIGRARDAGASMRPLVCTSGNTHGYYVVGDRVFLASMRPLVCTSGNLFVGVRVEQRTHTLQ